MRTMSLLLLLILVAACSGSSDSNAPVATSVPDSGTSVAPPVAGDCPAPTTDIATGRIAGKPFTVEASSIKEGILELRQGEDFLADRAMTVFLFLDEGEVPVGKTIEIAKDSGFGSPHVHMNWTGGENKSFESKVFMNEYRMRLSFHEERDGVLPGTIHLCLPDDGNSWVSGTFEATIGGFRLVDGKPDLSLDGLKNFDFIALDYLQANVGADAEIENTENKMLTHQGADGAPQIGTVDVFFVANGVEQARRFLFVKLDDLWQVDKVLEMHLLAEAHPYAAPGEERFTRNQLAWVVARELEKRIHAEHPGSAIYPASGYSVLESYSTGRETADATVSYRLGDSDEKIVLKLALEKGDDGWQVASSGKPVQHQAGLSPH